jgi:hypothetical protein
MCSRKTGGKEKFNILQPGVHRSRFYSIVILASISSASHCLKDKRQKHLKSFRQSISFKILS